MISRIGKKIVSFSLLMSLGVCQNIEASNAYREKMARQHSRQYSQHQERQFKKHNREFEFLSKINWDNPWTYVFATMVVTQVVLPQFIPGAAAAPAPSRSQNTPSDLQSSLNYSLHNTTSPLAPSQASYSSHQEGSSLISQGVATMASFKATSLPKQTPATSSSSRAPAPAQSAPPSAEQIATTAALKSIYCSEEHPDCVTIAGTEVTFDGTEELIVRINKKVNNLAELRKDIIPFSSDAIKTQVDQEPGSQSWGSFLRRLGIKANQFSNVAILDNPEAGIASLGYERTEEGEKSFNQDIADAFIDRLQQHPFLNFLIRTNNKVITHHDDRIDIHYRELDDFFKPVDFPITPKKNLFSATMPLDLILKRLIAAAGGEISLVKTSTPGEFHVRLVTLGEKESFGQKQTVPPTVDIVIDRSGSMEGARIAEVNEKLPLLLQKFSKALTGQEILKVRVHALDHEFISDYGRYELQVNKDVPEWKPLEARGAKDLTPIGRLAERKPNEPTNRIVIAFTDGEHNTGLKLDDAYYDEIKKIQSSGSFAQLFLCRVGSQEDKFFRDLSQIFAGSFHGEDTVTDCIERGINSVSSLMTPKSPIVFTFTLNKNNQIVKSHEAEWVPEGASGIKTLAKVVKPGDSVTYQGGTSTVPESIEAKRLRLKKELEALGDED